MASLWSRHTYCSLMLKHVNLPILGAFISCPFYTGHFPHYPTFTSRTIIYGQLLENIMPQPFILPSIPSTMAFLKDTIYCITHLSCLPPSLWLTCEIPTPHTIHWSCFQFIVIYSWNIYPPHTLISTHPLGSFMEDTSSPNTIHQFYIPP